MKLKTTLKLSALAVALASTSTVFAATSNEGSVDKNIWTINGNNEPVLNVTGQDTSKYQFTDFGSGTSNTTVGGSGQSRPVYVAEHKIGDNFYYLVDGKQILEADGSGNLVQTEDTITVKDLTEQTFQRGGTSTNYKEQDLEETSTVKRVDSNVVKYGEETTVTSGSASGNVAVTDSFGKDVSPFVIDVAGDKSPEAKQKDEVVLGIVNQNGSKYGVYAETVTAAGTKNTTLTSEGITTTGNIAAQSITLAGTDLTQTINDGDAATLAAANTYTDTKAAEAVKTANTYTDTKAAEAVKTANTYTDTKAAEAVKTANTYTDTKAAEAVKTANMYTDTKAAEAVKTANTYTDTKAAEAVKTANTYTDTKATETLAEAKSYTDAAISSFGGSINNLSKRLDDVEETAYRGTAIALAAAQQVPNIKPGQFAIFGGVGHYESESAVAFGGVAALADGRTSISAAIGTAGSEVGGRVGVSYVFGGN